MELCMRRWEIWPVHQSPHHLCATVRAHFSNNNDRQQKQWNMKYVTQLLCTRSHYNSSNKPNGWRQDAFAFAVSTFSASRADSVGPTLYSAVRYDDIQKDKTVFPELTKMSSIEMARRCNLMIHLWLRCFSHRSQQAFVWPNQQEQYNEAKVKK